MHQSKLWVLGNLRVRRMPTSTGMNLYFYSMGNKKITTHNPHKLYILKNTRNTSPPQTYPKNTLFFSLQSFFSMSSSFRMCYVHRFYSYSKPPLLHLVSTLIWNLPRGSSSFYSHSKLPQIWLSLKFSSMFPNKLECLSTSSTLSTLESVLSRLF